MADRKGKSRLLVAAIDFGTTYSGYAFSFRSQFQENPMKINTNENWTMGTANLISPKTPTTVLLTPEKKFDAFGYEAEVKYAELSLDGVHKDWYYFRRFKMKLHKNPKLKRDYNLTDETGKKMPARIVFSVAIRYLMDHLLGHLQTCQMEVTNDDIQWVITVPAIWQDSAKQFMREAAREAGITDDQLTIALEPEAASVYCQLLPTEKLCGAEGLTVGVTHVGTKYMVIDLGGGTADITVHQKQKDGTLKELYRATGGAWGGVGVDGQFFILLTKLIGQEIMIEFANQYTDDLLEIYRQFETLKRTIRPDMDTKLSVRIPSSLQRLIMERTGQDMSQSLRQRVEGRISWTGDKLRLDACLVKELFSVSINSITKHISEILSSDGMEDVNMLLMVGGFSESALVQSAIKHSFPNKRVIIPEDAGLAVLKGAVLYGHKPEAISTRIARYTYGVRSMRPFTASEHPSEKKVTKYGDPMCRDIFDKFIEKGETIDAGKVVSKIYNPAHQKQRNISAKVYVSSSSSPKFVTDEKCCYLGKVVVDLPQDRDVSEIEVEEKLVFGNTELMVEATERSSGKTFKVKFDFL